MSSNDPEIISSSVPMSMGSSGGNSSRGLQRSSIPRSPGEEEDEDDGKYRAAMTTVNAELAQQSQSSSTSNVGELVTKAKKAAASLWMILHAQNCRLSNCPHRGCTETKPLLLHVKICSAGPNFPCPMHYKGCNEARKLMAHYRKCKDVRSRQQATGLVGRQLLRPADQGSCLVCSLMARYAKSMMEKTATNNNTNTFPSKNDMLHSSSDGKVDTDENGLLHLSTHHRYPRRTTSMTLMPPPPPRRLSHLQQTNGSKANDHRNIGVTIPILWNSSSGSTLLEDDRSLVIPCPETSNNNNNLRQRAVSYDERQNVKVDCVLPPTTSGGSGRCYKDVHEDEELQLCDATLPTSSSSRGYEYNFVSGTRPRSASCSNLTMVCNSTTGILRSLPSHHECGTIAED